MHVCIRAINEMKLYQLHILGISESRWTSFGRLLYSGRDDNHHIAGVALILKKEMERTPIERKPVSARLLRARLYSKHSKFTIALCYSPTNDAEPEEKEAFYSMLQAEMERVPAHDVLIIMGDYFNTKVWSDNIGRKRNMGSQ